MKAAWVTKRLGDVAKTQYGISEPMNEDGKGFKIFRMGEVQGGRLLDTGRMKYADISTAEFEQYKLCPGDVLFNRTNSFEHVGKTGIFLLAGDYCFASYLVRLKLDRKAVLPAFVNHFMNSARFQESVKSKASKSINQANINATILSNELIQFPESLVEQQRVSNILDEAFDGIATAKANAEKNLQNASALFESHLQAVFTQGSALWAEKSLQQIGTTQTGSTPRTVDKENFGEFIPFIKPADFGTDGSLDYANAGLSEKGLQSARRVDAGSVLMVCIGATIGKCGFCESDVTTNQQINSFAPSNGVFYKFAYYQMRTESFQRRVVLNSAQATLPIINKSKWSSLTLLVPPTLNEQKRIAARLDSLAAETQNLTVIYQRKLAALGELKKSLLDQAFTGQL
jgi:type I restriction enzyme S subunit